MNLDFILFTAPKAKYSFVDFWGEVIFIPKHKKPQKKQQQTFFSSIFNCYNSTKTTEAHLTIDGALMDAKGFYGQIEQAMTQETTQVEDQPIQKHIPCLYLDSMVRSQYLIVYFHSSGEDIKLCHNMLNHLRNSYQINVIAMEYPGYSIHKGKTTTQTINQQAKVVYNYVTQKLGFQQKNIIVIGRSIGTGIALELVKSVNPRALVLISPFSNIKNLAKQFIGQLGHFLAKETHNNLKNIQDVKCSTFILHGRQDELVSIQNSIELSKKCPARTRTNFPASMTHSSFDYYADLSDPLRDFLMEEGLNFYKQGMKGPQLADQLFKCPDSMTI